MPDGCDNYVNPMFLEVFIEIELLKFAATFRNLISRTIDMSITFQCPSCLYSKEFDDKCAGKKVKCKCGEVSFIPEIDLVEMYADASNEAELTPRQVVEQPNVKTKNTAKSRRKREDELLAMYDKPEVGTFEHDDDEDWWRLAYEGGPAFGFGFVLLGMIGVVCGASLILNVGDDFGWRNARLISRIPALAIGFGLVMMITGLSGFCYSALKPELRVKQGITAFTIMSTILVVILVGSAIACLFIDWSAIF